MTMIEIDDAELAMLKLRAKHQSTIETMNEEVRRLKGRYDQAKDASLAAKKTYDEAVAKLSDVINDGPSSQMALPFTDGQSPAKAEVEHKVHWRDRPIEDLNLSKPMLAKALELSINTVGKLKDVADKKVAGYENGLTDIEGWSKGKAHRAETAMSVLCGKEPDFTEVPEAEPDAPAPESPELSHSTEDGEPIFIELLVDMPTAAHLGFAKGAQMQATRNGQSAVVKTDGAQPMVFLANEFTVVPNIAENSDTILFPSKSNFSPAEQSMAE